MPFNTGMSGNPATPPFGQTNTGFGGQPATSNVFGGGSAFGTTTTASGGLFGTAHTGNGLFGQTSTPFGQPASSTSVFGSTSMTGNLFGTTTPATQSTGLFGGSCTSPFGTPRPAFGGFGSSTIGLGLFGQNTSTNTGLFGSSTTFGATTPTGTTMKFIPKTGSEIILKDGVSQSINTLNQCITYMPEYENKSLEELRSEDYQVNRKGPQSNVVAFGSTTPQAGLFGTPAATSASGFSFGTIGATTSFGGTGTGLLGQNTSLFGKSVGFVPTTTSAAPAFSFGTTNTSLIGQNQQKPMFGQTTQGMDLFGQSATTQPSTFGTGTGFGGFGATAQSSTSLFGAKPPGFGAPATTASTSSSGTQPSTGGGLFGQKPATSAVGAGFGTFGSTPTTGTGLFQLNKPAGYGTTTGFGTNTGTDLFGQSCLANKPTGFNFGSTVSTGFGFGQPFAGSTFNFGTNSIPNVAFDQNMANMMQQQLQMRQLLLVLTNCPYGDSPLFCNPLKASKKREEGLKPTYPVAQKAAIANSLLKVSPLPAAKVKPKPITPKASGKVYLFDGLEDAEPSNLTFVPRKSVKKLTMRESENRTEWSPSLTTPQAASKSSLPTDILSQGDTSPPSSPLTLEINDGYLSDA